MHGIHKKIIIGIFCIVLVGCAVLSIIVPDRLYSENEKRVLAKFPDVTAERILSGKFSDEIETYLSDQFPGRDLMVTIKTIKEYALGSRNSGGVYFAKDGYLIEQHDSFSDKSIAARIQYLQGVKAITDSLGIKLRVMLVPTAGEILKSKLPVFATTADQMEVVDKVRSAGFDVVDVEDILREHADEYIFYKTDHHWTSLGAYYGYAAYMEAVGRKAHDISEYTKETLSSDFRGTTYNKVNFPFAPYDTIEAYYISDNHRVYYNESEEFDETMYTRSYLKSADKYAVFLNSNQASTKICGSGNGRILIIKDSYANSFAQFMPEDYEEVHMIDPRFFTGDLQEYIGKNRITEVLILYNIPNFAE